MTLISVWLNSERAVVATDSLGYDWEANVARLPDGRPRELAKIHLIACGSAILTGRGSSSILSCLATELKAVAGVDEAIERAHGLIPVLGPALGLDNSSLRGSYPSDEIYLLGWSADHGRIVAATWNSDNGFTDTRYSDMSQRNAGQSGGSFAPHVADSWEYRRDDAEAVLTFARHQVNTARAEDPSAPYGGRLVVAEIDHRGIRIVQAGDLGMPAPRRALLDLKSERAEAHPNEEEQNMMPSRPIAAVLLALAGCGGSDDAIDAAQIVPGAATKVVSATLDTADVWTSTATNHILQSVTITNDDTVSRTVLLTGSLTYTFPGGIAAGNAIYGWCRQSTDAFAVGAADFTHTVQATDDRNWTVAFNRQYALAAGATGIYYLVGRESSFTTNVTYFGENIRAELIKR